MPTIQRIRKLFRVAHPHGHLVHLIGALRGDCLGCEGQCAILDTQVGVWAIREIRLGHLHHVRRDEPNLGTVNA